MATINKTSKLYAGDKFAITSTDGRKLRLVIEQDQFPEDPRSWDNLGTMLCCHRDYQLGDCNSNRETEEQLAEICRKYGKSDEEIDAIMDIYDEYLEEHGYSSDKLASIIEQVLDAYRITIKR